MDRLHNIVQLVANLEAQGTRLYTDNKSTSATELRKTLQEIKTECQGGRTDALDHQKQLKAANKAKRPAGEKKEKKPKAVAAEGEAKPKRARKAKAAPEV